MPTYEYQCVQCHNKFEIIKSISEYKSSECCPYCKSNETNRCWSPPNVIIKNSVSVQKDEECESTLDKKDEPYHRGIVINKAKGAKIYNCQFENFDTAIHVENGEVHGKNLKFKGNKIGVVSKHSKAKFENIEIE